MIRLVLASVMLSGCTHVQVLPTINQTADDVSCCVAYAEIPPSTRLSLSIIKNDSGLKLRAGAKWKF